MRRCLSVVAVIAAVALLGAAPPAKLPPGLTPQIMKMMMTLPTGSSPSSLPAGVQPFSGCIPTMGYHYGLAKSWPGGPLYGYYNGKPVFTELMISAKTFAAGTNWDDALQPLPGYRIDHVDIWWEPHGHPGYQIPHYDIHAWYVPHAEHMKYCGNTSGTRPAFLR